MNFMGMGMMELGVVFLVAFLVLGPGRAIEMARSVGKVMRDLRRTFADLTATLDLESKRPPDNRSPSPGGGAERPPDGSLTSSVPDPEEDPPSGDRK